MFASVPTQMVSSVRHWMIPCGSYLYFAKVCFLFMTDTEQSCIESVIRSLFLGKRSSVQDDLPQSKLSSGFSRTTLQTSCEKIGLILGVYVALGLNEAVDTFKTVLIRNQVKYETFPDLMENLDRQGDCHFSQTRTQLAIKDQWIGVILV